MANYILIFWQWINSFSPKKGLKRNWDKGKKVALLKLATVTVLLIPVLAFYIKCYEVSVLFTNITMTNLYGNIPLNTNIAVNYDFSRSHDFQTDGVEPGVEIEYNIPEELRRCYKKPVFSEEFIENLKKDNSTISFHPYTDDLLFLNETLRRDFSRSNIDWDSICGVYKVHLENKAIFPFKPFFIDKTPSEFKIDSIRYKGYIASCVFGIPSITSGDTIKTDIYFLTSTHKAATHTSRLAGTSFKYYKNTLIDARDISRAIETFHITGDINVRKLKFNFLGATEFSAIYPEPDVVSVNSIEYNDSAKLSVIVKNGLAFHTKFPDMENKQQARTFAVTTLLTLLITLFLKYLYVLVVDWGRWLYDKKKRVFYILFVTMLLIPLLYVLFTLYFQIIF